MTNPDCSACPKCGTHKNNLTPRGMSRKDENGVSHPSGWYKACECPERSYTYSPMTGQFNLLSAVAAEFGIKKFDPNRIVAAVPPRKIARIKAADLIPVQEPSAA